MDELYDLRFPIGEFIAPKKYTKWLLQEWVSEITEFPDNLEAVVHKLTPEELLKTYRPNGWNIQQLVHHCADSHMNSIIRFKLTLTEDNPTIKPYEEGLWAELADGNTSSLENSLAIIKGVHGRWSLLLNRLSDEDLKRPFVHPESGNRVTIQENIGIYAWHCRHHLRHIQLALKV